MNEVLLGQALKLSEYVALNGHVVMAGELGTDNLASKLLITVIAWVAPIGALILAIFLIKDIVQIAKGDGQGSIGKVIVKIIVVLLLLGVMVAMLNYDTFATFMGNFFSNTVTEDNLPSLG